VVASLGFDMQTDSEFWIPDWGCEIELDLDVCQELGIVWLPNLNAVSGGLLFDQKVSNHGTLTNGPTWGKGKFGEPAITVGGGTKRIDIPTSALPLNTGTLCLWMSPGFASSSTSYYSVLDSVTARHAYYYGGGDVGRPWVFYNDGRYTTYTPRTFSATDWLCMAWAWNKTGNVQNLYQDGTLLSSITAIGTWGSNAIGSNVYLGCDVSTTANWPGSFANVSIHNRDLTAAQIAELYRNPFLLYWQPLSATIFDMRYDPSPYERKLRTIEDTYAAIASPDNIREIDGVYGTIGPYFDNLYTFFISDEGRLIPAGSTVTGFQIRVVSKSASNDTFLDRIQVYKNTDGYDVPVSSGSGLYPIGTTDTEYTFGDSTELFGTTWTNSDVFGLEVSFYIGIVGTDTLSIDGIEITTWYSDGSVQTITIPVASATASASAPTVTPGAATVTMPTASSTAAASSPTVTPGATTVTVTTCSATASASSPTITPTVTIASATASATAAAISPTITAGTSTITVSTAQATASSSAPTITPTVTIVSPTASATASASAPTVTAGATTITVTTGTATAAAIDAGITNATLITLGDATATAAASAPTVTPGGATITVGVVSGTAAAVDVTVSAGVTTITVGVVSAVAGVSELVIVVAGESAGSLLFTAYATPSIRSHASLQPSLDADAYLRPSIEGKVS
jgi:hypothetical protein